MMDRMDGCAGCELKGTEQCGIWARAEPAPVPDKKTAMLHLLQDKHYGKKQAVHSAELERLFAMNDRSVRRVVSALRKEGYPICSGDMGYYYADSQKEVNATVRRMNRFLNGLTDAREAMETTKAPVPLFTLRMTVSLEGTA